MKQGRGVTDRDQSVGHRIRLARTLSGLTQSALGEEIGVTFQQIQKYETGVTRIAAERLQEIARALGQPVDWFFEDGASSEPSAGRIEPQTLALLASSEGVLLLTTFSRIRSAEVRRRVLALVLSVADSVDNDDQDR